MSESNPLPEGAPIAAPGASGERADREAIASERVDLSDQTMAEPLAVESIDAWPDEATHQFSLKTLFAVLLLYSLGFAALRWIAPELLTLIAGMIALGGLGWVTLQPTSALARITWWLGMATYLVAIWGTLSASS